MKQWRQAQILDVIDHEPVASQEVLRQRLLVRGIGATQATISRDLKEIGLVKRAGDGAYVRPGGERAQPAAGDQLRRAVTSLLRGYERVDALLVLRTDRGQAQGPHHLVADHQRHREDGTHAPPLQQLAHGRGFRQGLRIRAEVRLPPEEGLDELAELRRLQAWRRRPRLGPRPPEIREPGRLYGFQSETQRKNFMAARARFSNGWMPRCTAMALIQWFRLIRGAACPILTL